MAAKGIYIYGIVPISYRANHFQSLKKSGVDFISFLNISAIVSESETEYLDFSDRESLAHLLVHHQKTIEEIMDKGFEMILPMKLGTIVRTREEVLSILSKGHDLIRTTLQKIEHLTEIDLAVTWADFSRTLKEMANHPDIIALKDDILKNTDTVSQIDQVKVGMLFQQKLNENNKQVEFRILDALSPFSEDIKLHEVMNDQMVTNSAFLINRNHREKFEQAINQLDEEFEGMLNFKLVGPLPCYSFYTIEVEELNPVHVAQAKKELGLREEVSESEIKKAYLGKAKLTHPDAISENDNYGNFNRINKAYHILLDYSMAARQLSKVEHISSEKIKAKEKLILVKIKE